MQDLLWLIPVLCLLGATVNGLLGKKLGDGAVSWIANACVGLSFVLSLLAVRELLALPAGERSITQTVYTWVASGNLSVGLSFLLDPLSAVMILVVSGVSFLIHVYSVGYMKGDPGYFRYFCFLNLFVFFMLMLVLAGNFLVMFVGWEGVGLCSYLLIGFWYEKKSASDAGKKAFIVNRIGDFGFLVGLFLVFAVFGTLAFGDVFGTAHDKLHAGSATATAIALLLFVGAIGKSAQLPLYVWLPDAMEGPTPVSALIHAATMVTAGVYMVSRCHVLFELAPIALTVVAIVGLATAAFAASIALVQRDIKRILAYSTVSQLGYMFLACGVGAFATGIFHLMTHAFFKALLFLAAGSVMHALAGELDLTRMGALKKKLPRTHLVFVVGALAIAGIVPFAGFFSKDEILFKALEHGNVVYWLVGMGAALMTAFYMFRAVFMAFHGDSHVDPEVDKHVHESPPVMLVPLYVLAFLSLVGGFIGFPIVHGGNRIGAFLLEVFHAEHGHHEAVMGHGTELLLMIVSVVVALIGILWAFRFYVVDVTLPTKWGNRFSGMYRVLRDKYYVDEFYGLLVVSPFVRGSVALWRFFDDAIIDGAVNGVAALVNRVSGWFSGWQRGSVQGYLGYVALGAFLIVGYYVLR
jgi:NADH-quinone oxidoreductase subunit L